MTIFDSTLYRDFLQNFKAIYEPFYNFKYGDEAERFTVGGINSTQIPILIISGTKDEFYGGMSPIYEKKNQITNQNCQFRLMDIEESNGHYDYFLTKRALDYQKQVKDGSFQGAIDKMLYMEHDTDFMNDINQFYLSVLSD